MRVVALLAVLSGCDVVFPTDDVPCGSANYASLPGQHTRSSYRFVQLPANWTDAEAACQADGAHLVAIDDAAELDAMYPAMQDAGVGTEIWVGAARNSTDPIADFFSVTGAAVPPGLWKASEPNNANGNELAAVASFRAGLADRAVMTRTPYACECDGKTVRTFDF